MMRILFLLSVLFVCTSAFCKARANYSSAINAGDFLYVSGQVPIDPATGKMMEGDIETLTNQAIDNIQHLLRLNGVDLKQVVSTVVYLKDIRDYDAMDQAYGSRFNFQYPPARDVVAAADLLYNARIEISCVAYKKRK